MITQFRKIGLTVLSVILLLSAKAHSSEDIVGSWSGSLKAGVQEFPLIFHVKLEKGELTATLDSPAQGAKDIPVSQVAYDDGNIRFEVSAAQAVYVGTYSADSAKMEGVWKQGPNELPLVLTKSKASQSQTAISRPQNPTKPYAYDEEFVAFKNHKAGIKLAGTLTLPTGAQRVPAVVMITGSGPQDRDQTFMGHKTFWVLADYLTQRGIAVLRFDDRGIGGSEGNFAQATSLDFADDANAAVNFLLSHPRIDPNAIGLIGHSEGGLIAPIAASQNKNVNFIVSLAGPGLIGDDIAVQQIYDSLRFAGLSKESARAGSQITKSLNQTVLQNNSETELADSLQATYQRVWASLPESAQQDLVAIGGGTLSSARVEQLSSPWTKYFLQHNPSDYLSKLTIPVLALHGEKDTQLEASANLTVYEKLLKGKHPMNRIERFPSLNHLFQPAKTGLMTEYVSIETTFSPDVMDVIARWVKRVNR